MIRYTVSKGETGIKFSDIFIAKNFNLFFICRAELNNASGANERHVLRLRRDHEEAIEKTKRECNEKWEDEMR